MRKKIRKKVVCMVCGKVEYVIPARASTYKTCSKQCMGKRFSAEAAKTAVSLVCGMCGKEFRTKRSHMARRNYCSKLCQARAYKTRYLGENNPNHKGVIVNADGYRTSCGMAGTHRTLHRELAAQFLGIEVLPKSVTVHHRDCNKLNNEHDNLAVLSFTNHRWLHAQFGSAVMWAYCNGKIDEDTLVNWSDDPTRARNLLRINLTEQTGVVKEGEFRGSPEAGNPEPSPSKGHKSRRKGATHRK